MIREINPKFLNFLNERLINNGLARNSVKTKDARTLFQLAMESCVGITESGASNDGPLVSLIQDTVGSSDHVAWCMSLVQTCLAYAEILTDTKSPIFVSEHCLSVWDKTPKEQRIKLSPLPGAIVIWQHGSGQSGHTGAVRGCDEKYIFTIEGNTGPDEGSVIREGDGVYFRKRSRFGQGDMKVLGYLKPF